MNRFLVLLYGAACYAVFLATFLYLVVWVGNVPLGDWAPKTIDSGTSASLGIALAVNAGLLLLFGLQHSVMARPTFKKWWLRIVPKPIERATYVMATNVVLVLMMWLWQPLPGAVWDFTGTFAAPLAYGLFALGILTVLVTTFLINHFELFGLQQVWHYFTGRTASKPKFVTPGPYKFIRHPLYVGWLMFAWCTPRMSVGHLLFAGVWTAYILVAIQLEERNLAEFHPEYSEYKKRTGMFLPRLGRATEDGAAEKAAASETLTA